MHIISIYVSNGEWFWSLLSIVNNFDVTVFTFMYIYTGPPSTINVTNDPCLNDIILSWSVTSDLMACGPVSYTLTISSDGIMRMVNTTDTYYHFTELTPETDYTISIQPSNSAGSGQAYTKTISTASNSKC